MLATRPDQFLMGAKYGSVYAHEATKSPAAFMQCEWSSDFSMPPVHRNPLGSYQEMAVTQDGKYLVTGTIQGTVRVVDIASKEVLFAVEVGSKVTSLLTASIRDGSYLLLAVSQSRGWSCAQYRFDAVNFESIGPLEVGEQCVMTVDVLSIDATAETIFFAVGTRHGDIYGYLQRRIAPGQYQTVSTQILRGVHSQQAVTSVFFQDEQTLLTCGRDGYYSVYRLAVDKTGDCLPRLEKLLHTRALKGILERVLVVDGDLIVLGFQDTVAVVRNVTKNLDVFTLNCGGVHRSWDFRVFPCPTNGNVATFTYTRFGEAHHFMRSLGTSVTSVAGFSLCKLHGSSRPENGPTFHTREVRACQFLTFPKGAGDEATTTDDHHQNRSFFITAGEDGHVRFYGMLRPHASTMGGNKQQKQQQKQQHALWPIQELHTLTSHISVLTNMDTVPVYTGGSNQPQLYLFLCGAREYLSCWKVSQISQYPYVELAQQSLCPLISEIPDTRIMDVSVVQLPWSDLVLVCTVSSDAMLRLWIYHPANKHFYTIGKASSTEHCYLCVEAVLMMSEDGSGSGSGDGSDDGDCQTRIHVYTGATDGEIVFWDFTEAVQSFLVEEMGVVGGHMHRHRHHDHHQNDTTHNETTTNHKQHGQTLVHVERENRPRVERMQARHAHWLGGGGGGLPEHGQDCLRDRWTVHASGVNAMQVIADDESCRGSDGSGGCCWVVSGGDDQSLSVLRLQDGRLVDHYRREGAHASAVKGWFFIVLVGVFRGCLRLPSLSIPHLHSS